MTQESDPLPPLLQVDDDELEARWARLQGRLAERFDREPGIESLLFLIGIQSVGHGYEPGLSKERKQDLIMEGTHCAFEAVGLYRRIGAHADGRGIWERTVPHPPKLPVEEQEKLLRVAILRYFEAEWEGGEG